MVTNKSNHSVVISGESGAGKTEAMKVILQYIAEVSGKKAATDDAGSQSQSLEEQILKANPVMEAFGNAKTQRNNNSSRFGKWIEISFDLGGSITMGNIVNYLLEKSRVVFQSEGERNYHVFYQLLAGCEMDPGLKAKLGLTEASEYHYLDQSGVTTVEGIDDEFEFKDMTNAMDTLGWDKDTVELIHTTTAAVLHIGNLVFEVDQRATEEDGSKVKNMECIDQICSLLKINKEIFLTALTSKAIGAQSVIYVSYNVDQATDARDALAKALYGNLFNYLIVKINESLAGGLGEEEQKGNKGGKGGGTSIGVLDIFGFESFETNSFEQLCINYCNEKLQFHFNEHIFRLEQEVYKQEGIDVAQIVFKDNQPTLDLIEKKRTGLFAMCDEEISVPRGSDEGFLSKAIKAHSGHESFSKPKPSAKDSRLCFIVHHYAGEVSYNCTKFLEKDKDQLHPDMCGVLKNSELPFLQNLFADPAGEEAAGGGGRRGGNKKKKVKTLAAQFKEQLVELMEKLNATEPHFIRCMKPNKKKVGNLFEADMMLMQLRYSGLLEVCRIRQIGYPVRRDFDQFLSRYLCLHPASKTVDDLTAGMQACGALTAGEWAKGRSKIFMRNQQANTIEALREDALSEVTKKIQRQVRGMLVRIAFARISEILAGLKAATDGKDETQLEHWLRQAGELPHKGEHLPVVQEARRLAERLAEERRVKQLLTDAIAARELNGLEGAVAAADTMNLEGPEVAEAKALIATIKKEREILANLTIAIAARDKEQLQTLLDQAEEYKLDTEETRSADVCLKRILEEESLVQSLRDAIAERNLNELSAFLSRMAEMGLDAPEVAEGKRLREELMAQLAAKNAVQEAVEARVLAPLEAALAKAAEVGVEAAALAAATELRDVLVKEEAVENDISAAAGARDLGALTAALAAAEGLGMSGDAVANGRMVAQRMEEENAARAAMTAALVNKEVGAMTEALNKAVELGLKGPEVDQIQEEMGKLGAQNAVLGAVQKAAADGDLAALQAAIKEAESMNVDGLDSFKKVEERLIEEAALMASLADAAASKDLALLKDLIKQATKKGLDGKFAKEMGDAQQSLKQLTCCEEIRAAIEKHDEAAIDAAVAKAQEAGVDAGDADIAAAGEAKKLIAVEDELTARIVASTEAGDKDALRELLEEASKLNLENDKVRQAKILVDREKMIKETREQLVEFAKAEDAEKLGEALERCLELGLEGPEVEEATVVRARLAAEAEEAAKLKAAGATLLVKGQSTAGVVAADLGPLKAAIEAAKGQGMADSAGAMTEAVALVSRMEASISVQDDLTAVLALTSDANADPKSVFKSLKNALDRAADLEMECGVVLEARAKMREVDASRRARQLSDAKKGEYEEEEEEEEEYLGDEDLKAQQEKLDKARHVRYRFEKFPRVRTVDDWVKGTWFNKKTVGAQMLLWQNKTIAKSITELKPSLHKIATRIHKCILGYCNDKAMNYPEMLAQDILHKGVEYGDLVDEIYIQLCKQLTGNPKPDSVARCWQIMCMCVGTFPPSTEFEMYLLNFILGHIDTPGLVGGYAQYAKRRLEGMINSGASGFIPSVAEIEAYKERPPILATIELVDGAPITEDLPITPDLNVGKVLEICTNFLDLTDPRLSSFGMFVVDIPFDDEDVNKPGDKLNPLMGGDGKAPPPPPPAAWALPRTPCPLRSEDYMGDVVVKKRCVGGGLDLCGVGVRCWCC